MAITRTKKDNLVETSISGTKVSDLKPKNTKPEDKNITQKTLSKEKKPGFIKSTYQELLKVEWPSKSYVIKWSTTVILFTAFFSMFLGLFDTVFSSGLRYIDCTSPAGRNRPISECNQELIENITFQG